MTEDRAVAAPLVLGIDIGGSSVKGAPVQVQTGALAGERLLIPTPQPATPAAAAMVLTEMVRHFSWKGPIGCGIPAVIRDGQARTAANIDSSWIGADIVPLFGAATGCAVTILNDADAAGLAEMRFGAGQNRRGTVIIITIGTGLGTALFRDGALVPNTEMGHLLLPGGLVAERHASAAVKLREHLDWQEWAGRLNLYLQHLDGIFAPDLFILGGAISGDFPEFSPHLALRSEVRPAKLRNDAGIVGAALAASGHSG